jgi:general secretion pathway protein L
MITSTIIISIRVSPDSPDEIGRCLRDLSLSQNCFITMRIRRPMRASHESNVTSGRPVPDPLTAGVWTLAGGKPIIADPDGPATLLVPTEQVRLLAVDLPLPTRAKRLAALPFAIEDRIAEPVDAVHLAIGTEIADRNYLVGVVRHEVMADWVAQAEAAGLGQAAMVPDALALPTPAEGGWSVDLGATRAVVRASDGTGFACPAPVLLAAWEAAGRPPCVAYGAPLPAEMLGDAGAQPKPQLYPLDLRQGLYARRAGPISNIWRRLAWVAVLGAAAHTLIATADTVMLRVIADRRAADSRALVATMGGPATADISTLATMLPQDGAPQTFLPLVSRVSAALTPLAASFAVRTIEFQANTLTMDLESSETGLADRVRAALSAARLKASVAESPAGGIRVTASPQ